MRIILLLIFLLATTGWPSQIISGVGIEGGLSSTFQKWNYADGMRFMKEMDQHENIGIFYQFLDFKYVNLLLNIDYEQKGGLDNEIDSTYIDQNGQIVTGGKIKMWDRLDYIGFAPRIKAKIRIRGIEPFVTIGASFDYMISKKNEYLGNVINEFKATDIAALYGIGIGVYFTKNLQGFFEFLHEPSVVAIFSNSFVNVKNDLMKFNLGIMYCL
jgi:hypothetical protein